MRTLASRILRWLRRSPPVAVDRPCPEGPLVWCAHGDAAPTVLHKEDVAPDATVLGPLVWVRHEDGTMQACQANEARQFRVRISGQSHEHVDTTEDGTWVYAARP